MNEKQLKKTSKFLSLVLRHKPEEIGISLDESGWTNVKKLLQALTSCGRKITMEELEYVVDNNNKKRFSFNDNKTKIRANQGHSVNVDLGYEEKIPPAVLYHGTATRFMDSIFKEGLKKMNRHHVHLSSDEETAISVGKRHGNPIVFSVIAGEMHRAGYKFFLSENGVWLTEHVPMEYLFVRAKAL